jgi:menaquinone-dependent protoporphyrinogen oxidase
VLKTRRLRAERRAQAAADVERWIDAFLAETGWHPAKIKAVAGALLYSKYNFLLRFVMKRISRQAGSSR